MVKRHLKRLAMPKSWKIKRKGIMFITRPSPGPHSFELGLPIKVILRDLLKCVNTEKEAKYILNKGEILVDGVKRTDPNFIVGLMDTISMPKTKEYFRVLLSKLGKLFLLTVDEKEANLKPAKITGKNLYKKKTQLNLFDGRNILVEKDEYKIGDTILIELPKQDIKQHIPLDKGNMIFLIGGKHTGETGIIENIDANKIKYRRGSEVFETTKKYFFVIGKDKPIVKIQQEK